MQSVSKFVIIQHLYDPQHVSGDTPPIIRSLKLHWQPLVFHKWKVVGLVVGGHCRANCAWRPPTTGPTTFQHVSGDTPPIIRSLKLHWQPLVFHKWKVVGLVVGGHCRANCAWRPPTTRPTTFQHVSGDTPPIIRSLKLHWQPLVFHTWKVVGLVVGGHCRANCAWRPPTTRPTTFHLWKTRDCQCSFRLLMMGGVSPETCWASYKYKIIKNSNTYCILLVFLYELCYDARIHENQVYQSFFEFQVWLFQAEALRPVLFWERARVSCDEEERWYGPKYFINPRMDNERETCERSWILSVTGILSFADVCFGHIPIMPNLP